jgi:F-type H+-transporting ATPase subunit b
LGEVIYNIILYKKHFMELTNLQFVTVETFIIQFVILLVVLWVLNRFIFTPYLAYLDQWEAKQEKVQADYNNAEAILAEKQKQWDEMLEKARNKGNALIEEAEALANSKKEKIISEAEAQAQDRITAAGKKIENERSSMLSGAKEHILNAALKLNEKIFKDEKASKDFMSKNIDSL